MQWLGVDTGGTFTDFVWLDNGQLRIHKVLSTPDAPERAILKGIDELDLTSAVRRGDVAIVHGTTVATNAALEGKGVKTAFITNEGLADMLTIGRQTRRELYNLRPSVPNPPVPPELCLATGGRLDASGNTITALQPEHLEALKYQLQQLQPDAVAINLLFSFLDDSAEKAIEAIVPEHIFCSRSSDVLPEYKEYERGMATWLNAWLGPKVADYLQRLQRQTQPAPLMIMQSSGGTINAQQASRRAVNLLLSGPAGGLAAAKYIGQQSGHCKCMTFDMGGTSTDVALLDGDIRLTNEGHLAHYPVAVPMVDMHTIGAGGGSIAYIDQGGMLRVGPESAGAQPGPACYGQGGLQLTVTDANAILGRLPANARLGGSMAIDVDASRQAAAPLANQMGLSIEATAQGVIDIANEHMTRALRVISLQKGYDPRQFELYCFGGAGGLHVCALAQALSIDHIRIPANGGVLSAFGMLVAPRERQLSRTVQGLMSQLSTADIEQALQQLVQNGRQQLLEEGAQAQQIQTQVSLDARYQGQSYTLNIAWRSDLKHAIEDFHNRHQQRYGHRLERQVELVNVRASITAQQPPPQLPQLDKPSQVQKIEVKLADHNGSIAQYQRDSLPANWRADGPLLITEAIATTWVASGWRVQVDAYGHLDLHAQSRHSIGSANHCQ